MKNCVVQFYDGASKDYCLAFSPFGSPKWVSSAVNAEVMEYERAVTCAEKHPGTQVVKDIGQPSEEIMWPPKRKSQRVRVEHHLIVTKGVYSKRYDVCAETLEGMHDLVKYLRDCGWAVVVGPVTSVDPTFVTVGDLSDILEPRDE